MRVAFSYGGYQLYWLVVVSLATQSTHLRRVRCVAFAFRLRACQALLQLSEPSAADDTTIVISNSSIHHKQVRPAR